MFPHVCEGWRGTFASYLTLVAMSLLSWHYLSSVPAAVIKNIPRREQLNGEKSVWLMVQK